MGSITTDVEVKLGPVNLNIVGGPQYASPFTLHSILYKRKRTESINIVVEAIMGGRVMLVDRVQNAGDQFYVFPNQRVPNPMSFPSGTKIHFYTENVTAGDEDHAVFLNWADFT